MSKYRRGGDSKSDDRLKPIPKKEKNKELILEALRKASNNGIIRNAIEGICSRTTYRKYMNDDPDFAEEVGIIMECMREEVDDRVEDKIVQSILSEEGSTLDKNQNILAIFYAKTRLKKRGFNEGKDEIKKEEDDQIKIEYVMPQPKQIEDIEDAEFEEVKLNKDEQKSSDKQ